MRTLLSTAPVLRAGQDHSAARRALQRRFHPRFLLTALFALAVCGGSLLPRPAPAVLPGYLVALLGKLPDLRPAGTFQSRI